MQRLVSPAAALLANAQHSRMFALCSAARPAFRPLFQLLNVGPISSACHFHSSPQLRSSALNSHEFVVGESHTRSLDLGAAFVGQVIEPPFEISVGESTVGSWSSTFFTHDRIYTSTPFAHSLSFQSCPLPFSLMLFKSTSMSHVDERLHVLDLSYENAVYVRPGFVGDTFKQAFIIKHLRNTRDGSGTIVKVGCELINQKGQLVFSVDKLMLYPNVTHESKISAAPQQKAEVPRSHILSHILYHGENSLSSPADRAVAASHLAILRPQSLILHHDARPIGESNNMSLSTLFRWTHPLIYNLKRYKEEERLVAGGLGVSAVISATSRGLFEILYEDLSVANLINPCSPIDMIGAMSYIKSIRAIKEGFEEVRLCTVGVKNSDVPKELKDCKFPRDFFTNENLKPAEIEQICKDFMPKLQGKIVAVLHRNIVRQSPYAQQRSIPLL